MYIGRRCAAFITHFPIKAFSRSVLAAKSPTNSPRNRSVSFDNKVAIREFQADTMMGGFDGSEYALDINDGDKALEGNKVFSPESISMPCAPPAQRNCSLLQTIGEDSIVWLLSHAAGVMKARI